MGLTDSNLGINPLQDTELFSNTLLISRFITTPLKAIRKYIPERPLIRVSRCYHLLLVIKHNPRQSALGLRMLMNSTAQVTDKNTAYLLELGYIRKIGKPRLIIPFQRFKVDTGYVITVRGNSVLAKIFDCVVYDK